VPLKNSKIENTNENKKIKKIFFLQYGPVIKTTKPKNNDKNKGTNMVANGIKILKISSCVNDIKIQ